MLISAQGNPGFPVLARNDTVSEVSAVYHAVLLWFPADALWLKRGCLLCVLFTISIPLLDPRETFRAVII